MRARISLFAVLLLLSSTSLAQTTPAQQAMTGGDSSNAEAASNGAVAAARFAPGAKLFVEPMDGFEQILSRSILKKKVPVVLVNDRANADFVLSGEAYLKKPGWLKGMVLSTHGKGNVSIADARMGTVVFAHRFKRADSNLTEGLVYQGWADSCAKDMKKALERK